jgi:hypothetical protein
MPFRRIILILLVGPGFAGPALAADYSLAPAVLDSGGLQAGSANYSASFSAAPGGEGTSTNYRLRSGYAGQLFDPDTLTGVNFILPVSLAANGSAKSISTTAHGAGVLLLTYEGRGFTSYLSSSDAPSTPGLYRVSAAAVSQEYIGSVSRDFVISGPLAGADALTKTINNAPIAITLQQLLANDTRVRPDGTVTSSGLSITGVLAGSGNRVFLGAEEDAGWIFFAPSTAPSEVFGYVVSDGVSIANGVVTVTAQGSATPFTLQFVRRGIPVYDNINNRTSLSVDFIGVPGQNYQVEWSNNLSTWNSAGLISTGLTGSFTVTFSAAGDHVAAWTQSMFFRAKR